MCCLALARRADDTRQSVRMRETRFTSHFTKNIYVCTNSQNEFEPRKKSKGTGNSSHDVVELLNSSSDEGDEEFSSNYFNDGANARKREVGRKRKQESGRGVDEERSGGGTKKGHVLKTKDEVELMRGLMCRRYVRTLARLEFP